MAPSHETAVSLLIKKDKKRQRRLLYISGTLVVGFFLGLCFFKNNSKTIAPPILPAVLPPGFPAGYNAYWKNEGPRSRGPLFEILALEIMCLQERKRISKTDLFQYLGPADYCSKEHMGYIEYAFEYSRFGTNDWAVYIEIKDGQVKGFGWNAVSVNSGMTRSKDNFCLDNVIKE